MNNLVISKLEQKKDKLRCKAHQTQTIRRPLEIRKIRNEFKEKIKGTTKKFYERVSSSNNSNDIWIFIRGILKLNQTFLNNIYQNITRIKKHYQKPITK